LHRKTFGTLHRKTFGTLHRKIFGTLHRKTFGTLHRKTYPKNMGTLHWLLKPAAKTGETES